MREPLEGRAVTEGHGEGDPQVTWAVTSAGGDGG